MRVRQLESFVCVCESGSITQAAAILNIVQPALGSQITALERELGVQLLDRSPRGIKTTPAGQYFLEEARDLLGRFSTIKKNIKTFNNSEQGHLSIGLTASLSMLLAAPLAQEFNRQNLAAKVHIIEDISHNLPERIAKGEIDLALAFDVAPYIKAVNCTPVLTESLFFVTGPATEFNKQGPIDLAELSRATFVISTEKSHIIQLVKQAMEQLHLPLDVTYQIESKQAIKGLIAQGTASALLPYGVVAREVEAGTLIARKIANPPLTRTLFLLQPSGNPISGHAKVALSIIEKFIAHLAGNIAFELVEPAARQRLYRGRTSQP
ncbi:LysR family nitrogen assimilation transcriptional regulator [Phyllobacterium sp. 1468]|uniref:LysR family transcriptional regulator n=1 Tax=Phyllobacterium sp. 1468 TaxID=2817759 RepID=UPI00285EFADC|nr:LysR family transcriptional regulator [Phyllobacterium sp. 1468]MDR6632038.1 LysR family nitrogen assimilation transcriptional regulator [Phyllobacterium sp. 1468]